MSGLAVGCDGVRDRAACDSGVDTVPYVRSSLFLGKFKTYTSVVTTS